MSTTSLLAQCHCRTFSLPISLPSNSLPQKHKLCICTLCRTGSGHVGIFTLDLPSPPSDVLLATLDLYSVPGGSGRPFRRWRCKTCGAVALSAYFEHGKENWGVFPGLLDKVAGVIEPGGFEHLESTGDGGVSVFFPSLVSDADKASILPPPPSPPSTDDTLPISCACGTVSLLATRPSPSAEQVYCYRPPNISNGLIKFLTTTCACSSCRLTTGSSTPFSSVHIPFSDLHFSSSPSSPLVDSFHPGLELMGMKAYVSSDKMTRYRCSGPCGASVGFIATDRPFLMMVSLGIVRGGKARGEEWCSWWLGGEEGMPMPTINAKEDAVDRSAVDKWEEGMEKWGDTLRSWAA